MVTLWIVRIQFTKQSSFIAINKFSKPYRSTVKRIFMENVKNQASSYATKDSISVAPRDVLQRYDLLEAHLDKLKPGEYSVCINYKK